MKKELKSGIFVIVVLVAAFAVINILRGADILGRDYLLKGSFEDIRGLVASSPVQIRGYNAGTVKSVDYNPESDRFIVVCSLSKKFRIPSDSRMVLYPTSLMGGMGIRIDMGESAEYVSDGDALATGQGSDLIASLAAGMGPLLSNLNSAVDSVRTVTGNINAVMDDENRANLKAALSNLRQTLSSTNSLSASLNEKSGEIKAVIDRMDTLSGKLLPMADTLQTVMNGVNGKIDELEIEKTLAAFNRTVCDLDSALNVLKPSMNSLIENADTLIKSVIDNPKKYLHLHIF